MLHLLESKAEEAMDVALVTIARLGENMPTNRALLAELGVVGALVAIVKLGPERFQVGLHILYT